MVTSTRHIPIGVVFQHLHFRGASYICESSPTTPPLHQLRNCTTQSLLGVSLGFCRIVTSAAIFINDAFTPPSQHLFVVFTPPFRRIYAISTSYSRHFHVPPTPSPRHILVTLALFNVFHHDVILCASSRSHFPRICLRVVSLLSFAQKSDNIRKK